MNRALLGTMGLLLLAGCGDKPASGILEGPKSQTNASSTPGTSLNEGPAVFSNRMLVEAGSVSGEGLLYIGDYNIRQALVTEPGLPQSTVGGACIVARIEGAGGPCRSDRECRDSYGALKGEEGYAYCLAGTRTGASTGSCWIKPNKNYCDKGKGPGSHTTPAINTSLVKTFAKEQFNTTDVKWKVIGCLNGPDIDGKKPCALRGRQLPSTAVMYDEGTIRSEPKSPLTDGLNTTHP